MTTPCEAEMPGLKRDDIQITVTQGDQLTISGERKPDTADWVRLAPPGVRARPVQPDGDPAGHRGRGHDRGGATTRGSSR